MDYSDLSTVDTNAVSAGLGVFSTVFSISIIIIALLVVVAMWRIFAKAGRPGWAALIPIYNVVVLHQIVRKPVWWIVLYFLPVISIVIQIIIAIELGKAFSKSAAFSALFLLLLPIGFFVIAFDKSKYLYGINTTQTPQTPEPAAPTNPAPAENPAPAPSEPTQPAQQS